MGTEGRCVTCGKEYSNLGGHYHYMPSHKPDDWPQCPLCNGKYNDIGQHWNQSDCPHPNLSKRQYDIIVGLVMGDGTVTTTAPTPRVICSMITKEYLGYLDDIFGVLSTGVKMRMDAEESSKYDRQSKFNKGANEDNYHDVYYLSTRCLPQLNEFVEWYSTGKKVWPEDIDLTPTVLKHWYVGDGTYKNKCTSDHIAITLSNEAENEGKVTNYFEEVGLPRPNNWSVGEQKNGNSKCSAIWNKDESYELLEYMLKDGHGIPPGFEYKWPKEFQ